MAKKAPGSERLYPMRVVARLTGLSAHTIRVWERRYGAVKPVRTAGNTRKFSAGDVRRLTLLRKAKERGFRIHEVARLEEAELERLTEKADLPAAGSAGGRPDPVLGLCAVEDEYVAAVRRMDATGAREILSRCATLLPPPDFVHRVVLPILRTTGRLWERGEFTVAHEHMVSVQVRGFLDALLRSAAPPAFGPRIVVATPEGHFHEFGALAGALLAAARGFEPVYLGPDVPEKDLGAALAAARADLLLLGVLFRPPSAEIAKLNAVLGRLSSVIEVWVGLPADHPARGRVPEVRYLTTFEELDWALAERIGPSVGA